MNILKMFLFIHLVDEGLGLHRLFEAVMKHRKYILKTH